MATTTKDDFSSTTATKGKFSKTISGNIETANDVDWFKFDVSKLKSDFSIVKFTGDSHILNIYDKQGQLIQNGITNGTATVQVPDVYYIAVSGSTGKYKFFTTTINDDFGSVIATAQAFNGTSISGKLEKSGDVDMFKTTLKSGNSYDFTVSNLAASKATLSLLDKKGAVVATDSDHDGKITFAPTSNADYYLSLAGVSQNTGDYKILSTATKLSASTGTGTSSGTGTGTSSGTTSGTKTTYDLYSHSPENGGTYVVDAGTGAFKFVIDMKKLSHTVVSVIKNFGADDSLYISNGWDKNLSMLRVADSGTIGQYQEHLQITQPFSLQNLTPEVAEIWLGNLPAEVGGKIQAIGTASIKEFNALSVGDIFWS